MKGLMVPLLRLAGRTRGARWGFVSCALTAIAVLLLHAVSQSLTLSGEQRAQTGTGRFEASVQALPAVPLGRAFNSAEADALLAEHGATDVAHELFVRPLEGSSLGRNIGYLEGDVFDERPEAYTLIEGTVPTRAGEVCVTEPLIEQAPLGTGLQFYGGALNVIVTCVVRDEFSTEDTALVAAPGTWATTVRASADTALWSSAATVTTFWSGGELMDAYHALLAMSGTVLEEFDSGTAPGNLQVASTLREEPRGFDVESSPWTFLIPAVTMPLLVGMVSALGTASLFTRSTESLHRIGLRRSRLQTLSLGIPAIAAVAGGLVGTFLGLPLVLLGRQVLIRAVERPLGPVVGQPTVVLILLGALLAGAVLSGAVASWRARRRVGGDWAWLRLPTIPWPSVAVLGCISAICVGAALWSSSREASSTAMVSTVVLLGAALVTLAPVPIAAWAGGTRRDRRTLLAGRQIVAGGGTWLIVLLFGLQALVATGGFTAATSSMATFNESTARLTPLDEVRLQVPDGLDAAAAEDRIVPLLRTDLGDPDTYTYGAVQASTGGLGMVYAVDTAEDAAAFLGIDALSVDQARAFEAGAVLRQETLPDDELHWYQDDDQTVLATAAVTPVPEADDSITGAAGLMKRERSEALGLPTSDAGVAFTGLDAAQVRHATSAADRLGFSAGWLYTPRPPDVFSLPRQIVVGAWTSTALTLVVALVYSLQLSTRLRPLTAGLRAQGLSAGWTREVAWRQLGMVVLWPTLMGIIGGVVGVVVAIPLMSLSFDVHVPWAVVGTLLGGAALSFLLGAVLCLRGVRPNERL